ncbi:MAG: flagellar filament capping protein FliD, partial [Longimicrobiales bacterium]
MLEALGVVTGDRGAVAQQVGSNAFTDGNGTQVADANTSLTSLFVGGEDAGVQVGDTFSITGTRGDGSEFTATYTVAAGDELQDVLDVLNSDVDGFQAGESTASASIDASGQLIVTDDLGGGSLLNLQIVSNNEGGGRLDFGDFQAIETGRSREVVDGADARLAVDGNFLTRSSNSVSDVIDGVTLDLLSTTEGAVSASVDRDTTLVVEELQAFVDAYNEISAFVGGQFSGAGAEEGGVNAPLSGDSTVLQMRNFLRDAMNTLIDPAVGDLRGLFAVGIEVDAEGVFTLNEATLTQALADDPVAVERLFNEYGTGSVATLALVSANDSVNAGNYDVEVTQAASRALVEGLGFSGTYVDDATADVLRIVDTGSGAEYEVALSAGMSMEDIVQAINAEFGTKKQHQVQNDVVFASDAIGTAADATTALADLHVGALNQGVTDGDVITLSGMTPDGISTFTQFTVTDATTQTLGDLQQALADSMSGQAEVVIENGSFSVTNQTAGQSFLNVQISSDNAGGGSLSFGTFADTVAGRGIADVTASEVDGQLRLAHDFYGSGNGIDVSFEAGGADGSASLGLAAGSYAGTDVQGTIDGFAATGDGEVLRGEDGTGAEGLTLSYVGSDLGAIGTLTYSRGVGAAMERATDILLSAEAGSIDEVVGSLDLQIDTLNDRVVDMEIRLDRRRDALILRFARLEEAVAVAQSQGEFLSSQLANLSAQLNQ